MKLEMLYSKIHRAVITDSNLEYVGSVSIDEDLMDASGLRKNQKVEILNINNGERFTTYVIKDERGSGSICINGAGARKVHTGDNVIIVAYALYDEGELDSHEAIVVHVDDENKIKSISKE